LGPAKLNGTERKAVADRRYFEICTLIAAREFDQQYVWSTHELAAQRAAEDLDDKHKVSSLSGRRGMVELTVIPGDCAMFFAVHGADTSPSNISDPWPIRNP
jgi:hypothetical protein